MRQDRAVLDSFLRAWSQAEYRGDVSSLRQMLDERFRAVGVDGRVFDKRAWLDRYRSGDLVHEVYAWDTVDCIVNQRIAVLIGRIAAAGSYRGSSHVGGHTAVLTVQTRRRPTVLSLHLIDAT